MLYIVIYCYTLLYIVVHYYCYVFQGLMNEILVTLLIYPARDCRYLHLFKKKFHHPNVLFYYIYTIKQDIRIYMLSIAGQTAGPNGPNFFYGDPWLTHGLHRLKNQNLKKNFIFFYFTGTGNS